MVLYYILVILIGILYLVFLELSKNVIAGWIVGILAVIAKELEQTIISPR